MCIRVRVCVCFLHDNSKSNRSRNMKFEHIVVYENISDSFDIGHCQTKVKVTTRLRNFSQFTTTQTVKCYVSAMEHDRKI